MKRERRAFAGLFLFCKGEVSFMDMELKWKKYMKEEMKFSTSWKEHRVLFTAVSFIFVLLVLYFGYALVFDPNNSGRINTAAIVFGFLFIYSYVILGIFENDNKIRKIQFFKKNKENLIVCELTETTELTGLKQNECSNIFLMITSEVRGTRKQLFTFANKTKKGTEIREYETDGLSQYYYKEINESEKNQPRLEIRKNKFISSNFETLFLGYSRPKDFCTEYTFFVPKGTVKKLIV